MKVVYQYTDIERPSKSGKTYTTTAYNEDGYLETITFTTADGTPFYTLTVDGELVEYFSTNASETTAPNDDLGYIYSFDGDDWIYAANNGQSYVDTNAGSHVMIQTGYVDVSGGITSTDTNWSVSIEDGPLSYLTEGDEFDVVLTFNTPVVFDEEAFESYDWTVTADGVTLTCEAELTTEGTAQVAAVVTIHVTVESVTATVSNMTASFESVA